MAKMNGKWLVDTSVADSKLQQITTADKVAATAVEDAFLRNDGDDTTSGKITCEGLQAGASGFVLKDIPPEELVAAVRTIAAGGAMLSPAITRRLIGRFAGQLHAESDFAERLERLTAREREVLQALACGMSNVEIADMLFIGAATVKTHVSSVLSKLGLRDRAQAVVFAYECGLAKAGEKDIGF